MGLLLLIAFIATPIIEIALFIEAGERIGLWPTLGIVVLTAIIGTWLLRWQGFATWRRASQTLQRNEFPMEEVFTGLCLVLAGALLLTPGFMTDAIGFALFLPPVRNLLAGFVRRRLERGSGAKMWVNGEEVDLGRSRHRPPGDIVEGEYREVEPDPAELSSVENSKGKPNPGSPWAGKS